MNFIKYWVIYGLIFTCCLAFSIPLVWFLSWKVSMPVWSETLRLLVILWAFAAFIAAGFKRVKP